MKGGKWILTIALFLAAYPVAHAQTKSDFLSRATVDVMRNRASRVEGGDWDDQKDRISFKVKIRNGDPNRGFEGLKLELFVFGQSLVDRKALKLFQRTQETFSLTPLQTYEFNSPEIVSMWDDTGAIFGEKYKGWYLRIYGPDGSLWVEKNVSSFLKSTSALASLTEGEYYDSGLKPVKVDKYKVR